MYTEWFFFLHLFPCFSFNSNILDLLPATIVPGKEALGHAKELTDAEDILYQESILSEFLCLQEIL